MKTWQMIKELTENPEKEFKRIGDELTVSLDTDNCLLWKSGHAPFNINHVWEEAKKPVDFMTAFKAFRNMKTISVKCDGMKDAIFLGESNGHTMFHEEYIDNGKWYIED